MEESTEAHMETDVSSTTEDVPETQKVTGLDGNVEMVIVVEKVKEEEINTDVQNENQRSLDNENTQEVYKSNVESSQMDTEVQVVPSKPPITVIEVESSNKTEPAPKLVNKALVLDSEIELPTQLQQTGDVDSSIIDTLPLENVDMPISVEKSPNKNQEESIVISPKKDLSSNPVQISPTKESQINDTITSTPIKEPLLIEPIVNIDKILNNDTDNDSQDTISSIIPINVTIERESSNDSQVEINSIETNYSEASEKEHNKSISRELKSLINSAKESKIISECTQLKSKTRKSRSALDAGNGLNSSVEADKIHSTRRHSNNSQKSNCSEKSEKVAVKRSMRSQNPEFVSKVKQFLNSVTGKGHKGSDDEYDQVEEKNSTEKGVNKEKNRHLESSISPSKIKKVESPVPDNAGKLRSDPYCWRCHWVVDQSTPMACTVCPRSFHYKCLSSSEKNKIDTQKSWVCPECMIILQAESSEIRSQAMKKMSLGKLSELLKYALERMMDHNGVEPFLQPVDRASFPDYDKYIVHPVDLSLMQANIAEGSYGSTAAFLAEAQWILHNSIIFNTLQSKLTAGARALVRSCRTEMGEIEACPECYSAAHARKPTWFTDVCTTPHILLWAKLKGFPYWPAKGMSVSGAGHVDVRFFGAHDRAWVPSKDCFLYSEKDPNNFRTKRQDIIDSMQEAEQHIRNISRKYGKFVYPPFKTQLNPNRLNDQLKMMIPSFEGEVRSSIKDKSNTSPATKEKNRSNSKSSKSSFNEGDTSENEDAHETENLNENEQSVTVASRKMADGAEIAREDEDTSLENSEIIDVDDTSKVSEPTTRSNELSSQSIILQMSKSYQQPSQSNKVNESSRKRRRSDLEEAVITIMDSSINTPDPKRKKIENRQEEEKKKPEEKEPSNSNEVHQNYTSKKNGEATKKDEVTSKDNDVSSNSRTDSDNEKNQRVTPIRIALVPKDSRHNLRTKTAKESMAKILNPTKEKDRDRDNDKTTPKYKHSKADKSPREDRLSRSEKRRNSRNKSLSHTPKSDKTRRHSAEKKSEKGAKFENETTSHKDNSKESKDSVTETSVNIPIPSKETSSETEKFVKDKHSSPKPNAVTVIPVKDRLQYDDDTSLAVIARESRTVVISNNTMGLPTISCVRSLSTTAQNTGTTVTKSTSNATTSDVTLTINSDSALLIPTSYDNAKSIKEASCKLQKLRNDTDNLVGRVGVRAFARMTSPEKTNKNDSVEIEIKAEPIDVDDADRQIEKLNLMNAFRLRPVNPINTTSNLREVRINKVLVTPLNAKKTTPKTVEVKPRAKKSFPQPKKPEDGQLNSKNSMVYIPIQPPMTQAPVRPQRIVTGPTCIQPIVRPSISSSMSTNSQVNTVTTPVMQVSCISSPSASASSTSSSATIALGAVPTSVHTVPLMTSVNGQWMFSFQPVMSVGVDNSQSPPIVNGVAERGNNTSNVISLPGNSTHNQQLQISSCLGNTSGPLASRPATSKTPGETNTPGEPPRLQQRPAILLLNPLDPNAPIGSPPTPSCAGPLSAKLNQNAVKLTDFFRNLLEDSLEKLEEPASLLTIARLQLEQAKWKHETEIKEIKHNQELTLAEMRALFEKEKVRLVAEARRTAQLELEAAVKVAKSKQWCANCSQEAQFYCCWNTSYCDYPCQRAHWSQHFNVCAQQRQDGSNTNEPPTPTETRLQPQPDNMPVLQKNSSAPALTVGGKLAPSRVYTQDPNNTQKNAIIVSMVEDPSGNQTMKCVGTYKSSVPAQNMPPIIINKQIRNSEETANKKVVSSGGYLIVGSGSNSAPVVTSARRTNTIQF